MESEVVGIRAFGIRAVARRMLGIVGAAATAVVVAAGPASAHTGRPDHGFAEGFQHPFTGADHLLAMVGVGVVAMLGISRAWGRSRWVAPAAFVGGMITGGGLGLVDVSVPGAEGLIVASVIACGVAIAAVGARTGWWAVPLLVLAGAAHGNAHGLEAPHTVEPVLYTAGFVVATVTLHLVGLAAARTIDGRSSSRLVLGAAVAGAGFLLI